MGIALQLFGGFRAIRDDGQVLQMPDRSRALLAYLATADSPVQRAVLAAFLSPDECEQDQRRNLRQALYAVRQTLGREVIVCNEAGDLGLNLEIVRADAREFQQAIADGDERSALQAIKLYHGSFLEGETCRSADFEDWLRTRRTEFLEAVVRALLRVIRLEMDRGLFEGALGHGRRALELDPFCEDAHRQVIRCLAALGERSSAIRHYEFARQLFANELGVQLDAQTAELRRTLEDGNTQSLAVHRPPLTPPGADVSQKGQSEAAGAILKGRKRTRAAPAVIGLATAGAAAIVTLAMIGWPEARLPAPQPLPTIAVLPFESGSGDNTEAAIGHGLAEELTAMLASHPGLSVLSPSRARRFEPDAGPDEVRKRSGVRYVLNGSARRSGEAFKITARLMDAQTGFQVWSTQLVGDGGKLAEIPERIAEVIEETLIGFSGTIEREEQRQAWSKSDRDLLEQDYVRRGEQYFLRFTPGAHAQALRIWHEGLARFPASVRLRLSLASVYRYAAEAGFGDRDQNLRTACELGRQIEQAPRKTRYEEWLSHWLAAKLAQWCEEDFGRSIAEIEIAIAMAPYDASARADLAELLANTGRTGTAIDWLREAIRRDPKPPDWYYRNLAWAYYLDGRTETALQTLQSQRHLKPSSLLAVVLARLGRDTEAREVAAEYKRLYSLSKLQGEIHWPLVPELKARWLSDLRSVGLGI